MQKIDRPCLQGTCDLVPEQYLVRSWLFDHWKNVSLQFAYQEYGGPVVEKRDLWMTKMVKSMDEKGENNEESVNKMSQFTLGEIDMSLRSEMTPSMVRMLLTKINSLPLRWFSVSPVFRYETKYHGLQYYQWNCDLIGVEGVGSEIEMLSMVVTFFKKVGLTSDHVVIRLSDRRLLEAFLQNIGVVGYSDDANRVDNSGHYDSLFRIISKYHIVKRDELTKLLIEDGHLTNDQIIQLYNFLEVNSINALKSFLSRNHEWVLYLEKIFQMASHLDLLEYLVLDLTIVPRLSYYTGTIFEAYFRNGITQQSKAILDGGRYDNLLSTYSEGKHNTPCIGFTMGDIVLIDGMEELKLVPKLKHVHQYLVVPFNETLESSALLVALTLRTRLPHLIVETYLGKYELETALDYANKIGVLYVIILFPDEWTMGKITVKEIFEVGVRPKYQKSYTLDEFINHIKYD